MTFPCLVCCSVKADRAECPCYLSMTFDGGAEGYVDLIVSGDSVEMKDHVCVDNPEFVYELALPRTDISLSVYSGVHGCTVADGCAIVPPGEQMDELFAWSGNVSTMAESVSVKAEQGKQYAYVFMSMECEAGRYETGLMRFESNVCGMNLQSMKPVSGNFEVEMYPVFENYYRICVPRQQDDSLMAVSAENGRVLPLGEYIAAAGFDWSKRNLDDVYVTMSDLSAEITVEVVDWEEGCRRRVVI